VYMFFNLRIKLGITQNSSKLERKNVKMIVS